MPTKTFYNLSKVKREKLLDAVRKEFSRVPFNEVSINQIIKTAGISRGSFYQYFNGKQDTLEYLLADYQDTMEHHALDSLEKSGGDLFQMFIDVFDFTYTFVTEKKNNGFFKNVFSDARLNTEFLLQWSNKDAFGGYVLRLLPHINMDVLNVRGKDDFENMMAVLLPLTGTALATVFFDMSKYKHIRLQFIQQLDLLKRGFLKLKEMEV